MSVTYGSKKCACCCNRSCYGGYSNVFCEECFKNNCKDEIIRDILLISFKSYAQYSTYERPRDDIIISNNGSMVFKKKIVERGDKITLVSGNIKLAIGSYLVTFLGVVIPSEHNTELSLLKQKITIANTMNTTSGQITLSSIIHVDESGGVFIYIKNVSGFSVSFYTTSPNNNTVSPSIIIQEI